MANFVDDTINFGFGLFAYSREKIESFVEKMVDAGKVEKQDAQSLTHDLIQKGSEQKEEIRKMISDEVRKTADDLGINRGSGLTKEDIREIIKEELANQK